ncbi:lymphatic vessel endothelial hyaluronic acid receptor 1 [Amblyraja radiata]|uniref:lymphatic vessel endothelial hyaluronic acid receptor 1 n=1 Tax=Amblyraja radiata TaxID=386614 RepID=UPI001403ACCD|nr:lymphatic vessel endothelial hyaluronic acid receptor 1 [Amblyraja radiata]
MAKYPHLSSNTVIGNLCEIRLISKMGQLMKMFCSTAVFLLNIKLADVLFPVSSHPRGCECTVKEAGRYSAPCHCLPRSRVLVPHTDFPLRASCGDLDMARWGVFSLIVLAQVVLVLPQAPLSVKDMTYDDCRVWGIFHISLNNGYNLNLSQAYDACSLFDAELATKAQMERAHKEGFEKCKYGWVEDGFVVIPRVTPKYLCGKNNTGVVVWKASKDMEYDAFCFLQNDSQKRNACEPLIWPTTSMTEITSMDLRPITPSIIPAFSSDVSKPSSKTTTWKARFFSPTSIEMDVSSSQPTQVYDKPETERAKIKFGKWILYWVLGLVLLIVFVVFVIALVILLRRRKSYSYSATLQPKETEMWNHGLMANNS